MHSFYHVTDFMDYNYYAETEELIKPVYVAPVVSYLCHDTCMDTGGVFEVQCHI